MKNKQTNVIMDSTLFAYQQYLFSHHINMGKSQWKNQLIV